MEQKKDTQLPAEVADEIWEKAKAYAKSHGRKEIGYYSLNWHAGATEYAIKLHQAEQEINISDEYIKRVTEEYDALNAKCDRYEAALKEIRGDGQKFIPAKHDILAIANEALSAGEGEKEPPKEVEYMPVHPEDAKKPGCPKEFPMHLLNADQAFSNHGQTLQRLKERGGLGVVEILAIVNRKRWDYFGKLKWEEALTMLNNILNQKEDKQ